jgi:DNA-binding response OmpR family regulator
MQFSRKRTDSIEKVHDLTEDSIVPGVKSLLILEDDLTLTNMLRVFLESNSFTVICVTDGVEGLRRVMTTDFDIILCDLVMPNVPGDMFYVAVERTKKHLCKRFVFMTGHKTDPKWSGFLSKVDGPVIEKPFALPNLLSTIQTVLTENALNGPKPD